MGIHGSIPRVVRGVLERKKEKKLFLNGSFVKRPRVVHMFNHGWWRLAVGGWRLAVGGAWWLVIGGWWWLAVVGHWQLVAAGSWRLAFGGPLRAVLNKKKI